MYTWLYKCVRLAFPDGRAVHRNLKELKRTQWLPPEELQALQLHKIKRLVEHAFTNVPFYRQRFQEAGIYPNDIKTLDDFRQIPVLTRGDVQRNLESFIATNFSGSILHQSSTSGSTGEPLKFYYDIERAYWNWAAWSRIWSWFGLEPGCRSAWVIADFITSPTLSQRIKLWLKREKGMTPFDMSEDKMQAFAKTLMRFKPELIVGYCSSLWLFAQYLEKKGITDIQPRVIIGAGDKLYDFQRELIEKVFGCPVSDYYAANEVGPMAAQCPTGSMHVSAELRYLEVIADGRPAEPGEIGEVIVTDLANSAMPFIRYRNGDLARYEDQLCPCGRGLPVLSEIVGRKTDFLTTPEGKLISGFYFINRLKGWPGVKKYRVHQLSVDKVEIVFEVDGDLDQGWLESRRQEFQAHLGESVQLSFKRVEHIPLTSGGKHHFIISAVPVNLSGERTG